MQEKRYILKKGDYYLCDITKNLDINNNVILSTYIIDKDFRKLYNDFEEAEEDRKLIFIETGFDLAVKIFRKED